MKQQKERSFAGKKFLLPVFIISIISLSIYVTALPSQPSITYISNETSSTAGIGSASSDDRGGYITTVTLSAVQQNYAWKAYVGNVTGKLILEDQSQFSIYEWDILQIMTGNVYISRNGTVNWGSVNCSDRSNITTEDTFLNLNSSNSNSINRTFNATTHKSFKVAGTTYQNSTCPAIATYLNDAAQAVNENAKFQELLLADSGSNLIYMTMMEQDLSGFDASNYDFQAIIAEDESRPLSPTTYYFYVELEG